MSITAESTKTLDIGRVLSDGLGALSRNFGPFFLLALLLEGIPSGLSAYGQLMSKANGGFAIFTVLGGAALLVTGPMLQAALIYGTLRTLEGRSASMSDCLTVARKHWLGLLGLGILEGFALIVGFVLLIVPGVLLLLRWSAAGPLIVMEGLGIQEAMGRSASLTRNRRWSIFLLGVIYIGAILVLDLVIGGVFIAIVRGPDLTIVLSPLLSICNALLIATVMTALFRHLRGDGDGAAPDQLAEVFA